MAANGTSMRAVRAALFGACAAAHTVWAADVVWLEAERFAQPGGWKPDAQFIDQMGSPYLLADGLGTPVTDAVTRVELPAPGRWRLWVRTRDWVPEHHPGRFEVRLNGRSVGREFGASGQAGWRWEDGGAHELDAKAEVRLVDLTGYYGRCDVVVLADPAWNPPGDAAALAAARERYGGVSAEVRDAGEFDVVVTGGGLAGCMAAVAAARAGARTALIQNRPVLGGNGSTEILVPPVGFWPGGKPPVEPRETGIIEEAGLKGNQRDAEAPCWSPRLLRIVTAEPGLSLFLDTHATGVDLRPGATNEIAAVTAVDVKGGRRLRFPGRVFVDCTGDGSVGVAAGALWRQGREARAEFDEPMAPETANATTMGNSLKFASRKTGGFRPFEPPAWALDFATCDAFPEGRHPTTPNPSLGWQWKLELGGTRDTYREKEEIRDELLRLIYGLWSHLKNDCPELRAEAQPYELAWVGTVTGVRESRRLVGDYLLTERDVERQTRFPDRVAFGGWGLDDHNSGGFLGQGPTGRHPYKGLLHSVPFRSLYSTNVANLLLAGRDISTTHAGMGSTRVMMTCAVIGQAAGTAAALCAARGQSPRALGRTALGELQQRLLKDGAYLVDLPNRDPRDLARSADVRASSEAAATNGTRLAATNAVDGFARAEGGRAHAWAADAKKPGPHWIELSWPTSQTFNVAQVTFATRDLAPARLAVEAWDGAAWRTVAEREGKFRRHVLALKPVTAAKIRVVLPAPAPVCEIRVYDEPPEAVASARRTQANQDTTAGLCAPLPWEQPGAAPAAAGQPPAEAARRYGGIVADDAEAEFTGAWKASVLTAPFIGAGYRSDSHTNKGEKAVCFRPTIPQAGAYDVYFGYSALANRSSCTPVTIATSHTTATVRVDQRVRPALDGQFHRLGRFELEAGSSTRIVVGTKDTDGYVVADAVLLVPCPDH